MAIVVGGLIGSGVGALIGTGIGALISYFRDEPGRRQHPDGYAPPCPEESQGGGTAETQQQSPAEKDPGTEAESHRSGRCEARPQSRPYMACLKIQRGASYIHCGGFLVSENFVLTAAHCQGDEITVILGAHNFSQQEPNQQRIRVRRQIPHPQYDSKTVKNDIMLLQLEKPAKLNGSVKTIPLPQMGEWVKPGMVGSVAGWGRSIAASNVLQEVEVKVVKDDKCLKYNYYDQATMLCAEHPQKWEDIVPGDSGGPLVCDGKVQGIASRGSRPGKIPGTYTRVSAFIGWIQNEMGQL